MWGWISRAFCEIGLGRDRLGYVELRAPFRAPQTSRTQVPTATYGQDKGSAEAQAKTGGPVNYEESECFR